MSLYITDGKVDGRFAAMLVMLAEAVGASLNESRIRLYADLLGDIPLDRLRPAFRAVARDHRYPTLPTPGEIRTKAEPTVDDRALLAWTGLSQAAGTVGAWTSLDVDDQAAAQALLDVFGSWPAFCELDDGPQLALKRQEFLAAYRKASLGGTFISGASRRLLGRADKIPPPELAPRTWVGRLTAGGAVEVRRDRPALTVKERKELPGA